MAMKEIRAVLDTDLFYEFTDSASTLYRVYNKKVNLTEFTRSTIQTIQAFHNTFDMSVAAGNNQEVVRHTFVTTYPVSFYALGQDAIGRRVPNASDENVHYRETEVFNVSNDDIQTRQYHEVFPTEELAYTTNLSIYTPFVYITVMYIVPNFDNQNVFVFSPSVSLYMVVEEKEVSDVEYAMGIIAERESASWAQREASGSNIANNVADLALNLFPMWRTGGSQVEGMLRYGAFGGDTSFYYKINNLQSESMRDIAAVRSDARVARTMVQGGDPFGAERLGTFYPDWLSGIVSNLRGGNERISTNVIPKRQNDNGTTRMFAP
jgi:hypothetical protein